MSHSIPTTAKVGFAVIVVGTLADLVAHLEPGLDPANGTMTGPQLSAHLVMFVGMVLVLMGVVVDGVRSGRRVRGSASRGRHFDAVR